MERFLHLFNTQKHQGTEGWRSYVQTVMEPGTETRSPVFLGRRTPASKKQDPRDLSFNQCTISWILFIRFHITINLSLINYSPATLWQSLNEITKKYDMGQTFAQRSWWLWTLALHLPSSCVYKDPQSSWKGRREPGIQGCTSPCCGMAASPPQGTPGEEHNGVGMFCNEEAVCGVW